MLKEYDCWLQYRKVTAQVNFPKTVFVQKRGEVTDNAAREFAAGIERLLGLKLAVKQIKTPPTNDNAVFLLFDDKEGKNEKLKTEGFKINILQNKILITAADENGLLYGVYRFLSLLANGELKYDLEISESPVSPLRIINHWDNFDGTIERGYAGNSLFYKNGNFNFDIKRIEDYARLLASVGINRISINNVNVRDKAKLLITKEYLSEAAKLAAIFRRFGIRLLLSINFGAPWSLGKLPTSDPLDASVAAWWKERAALIYKYIPDLAGFLVKADSEGEPGPFQYNRTHADGANMLAKAVKPFGGEIIWRCFVYNCQQDWRDKSFDRARASYDHFKPLDGSFDDNVILQIKFGPYDFQVREPVSPLFGALTKTRHIMELQITQEYTGHQIDLCYLPSVWQDILEFDTSHGQNSKIMDLIKPYKEGSSYIEGFAAVVNVGLDNNWTGHTLAQANLYGYGRIIWNPCLTAKEIAKEWSVLSFGKENTEQKAAQIAEDILLKSYRAYEKYNAPFGVCFMVTPNSHYGPNIEGYEFSRWGTYHRADAKEIGIDRTKKGTGYTGQYSPNNESIYEDPAVCPENQLLFFHRLKYDFIMKNGKTLLQNIYDNHFEGYDEAVSMTEEWKSLSKILEKDVYKSVLSRFERQLVNAREWRDQINTYFFRRTGIGDKNGRKIFD
ncbi:MAG: alpha-glucuronidase [Treponema sp.]|nr:alpha-glucuronidase [Treponema sp.]